MQFTDAIQNDIETIITNSVKLKFDASCDPHVANLCAVLASQITDGKLLELGTGTGLSTLHICAGMDGSSSLDTVDVDEAVSNCAKDILAAYPNVRFHIKDGGSYLKQQHDQEYDYIFADAWPGKFSFLDHALRVLKRGGIYIIDDLYPQSNWPDNHQARVDTLMEFLREVPGYGMSFLEWGSGVALVTKNTNENNLPNEFLEDSRFAFLFSEISDY